MKDERRSRSEQGFAFGEICPAHFLVELDAEAGGIVEGHVAVAEEREVALHVLGEPRGFDEVVFNAEKAAAGGADISRGDGGESSSVTVEGGRTVVDFGVLRDFFAIRACRHKTSRLDE